MSPSDSETRVLVLAPLGRDSALLCATVEGAGHAVVACGDASTLETQAGAGAGALVLTEEALDPDTVSVVRKLLQAQSSWSDLPVVMLVGRRLRDLPALVGDGAVTVLERPVRRATLLFAVRSALRARRRQYQVRDLLASQEHMNETLETRVGERTEELLAARDETESERRQAIGILESITDAFAALDRDARLVYVNRKGRELLGAVGAAKAHDPVGTPVWDLMPGAERTALARDYAAAVENGTSHVAELFAPPLGAWLEVSVHPTDTGATVSARDITEHKRSEEELMQAVQEVMADTAWFSRSLLEKIAQIRAKKRGVVDVEASVSQLTKREREVLERMAVGRDNARIAADLGVAEQTVRNYITNIYEKLGVHSRADAIVWARERALAGF